MSIFKNWIVKNLLIALAVVVVLCVSAMILLNVFTKHNHELTVPDLNNMTVEQAVAIASEAGMRVEVTDSIFARRRRKGTVYRQVPSAGSKVKQGRRIMLTINAVNAKKVTMPNLVGYSLRQAKAEILSRGLVVGRLIYVNDIATNNVLRQLIGNMEVQPGTYVESESVVDLVLGLNPDDNQTCIPDVRGLKMSTAVDAIHDMSLNVGRLRFDSTVKTFDDSLDAVVYSQRPEPSSLPTLMGGDVTIYLTIDKNKIPAGQ